MFHDWFFPFLISLIGFFSAFRILIELHTSDLITEHEIYLICCVTFLIMSTLVCFLNHSSRASAFLLLGVPMSGVAWATYISSKRLKRYQTQAIRSLDFIVLSLKCGLSFRSSIRKASMHSSNDGLIMRISVRNLETQTRYIKSGYIARDFHIFTQEFVDNLLEIDVCGSHQIEQIEIVRERYKLLENFRQKSRQAQLQARAQSIIMSILYFSCLIFAFQKWGFTQTRTLFLISFVLHALGGYLIWKKSGISKWSA